MQDIKDRYKYRSTDVAKYIVAYANRYRYAINMTKMQKLLYIAYGVYLSLRGGRLTDEHPQVWPYGPVFPATRINLLKVDFQSITMDDLPKMEDEKELDGLIELVFKFFGDNNAVYLSEWSHQKGSPWERTTMMSDFKWGYVIPDQFIKSYFDTMVVRKAKND